MEDGHAGNTADELKVGQVILIQDPGQVVDLQCVVVPVEDRVKKGHELSSNINTKHQKQKGINQFACFAVSKS